MTCCATQEVSNHVHQTKVTAAKRSASKWLWILACAGAIVLVLFCAGCAGEQHTTSTIGGDQPVKHKAKGTQPFATIQGDESGNWGYAGKDDPNWRQIDAKGGKIDKAGPDLSSSLVVDPSTGRIVYDSEKGLAIGEAVFEDIVSADGSTAKKIVLKNISADVAGVVLANAEQIKALNETVKLNAEAQIAERQAMYETIKAVAPEIAQTLKLMWGLP